jgi:hypothetical protein
LIYIGFLELLEVQEGDQIRIQDEDPRQISIPRWILIKEHFNKVEE